MGESLEERYRSSPLFGSNAAVVEQVYEDWLENPSSVDPAWARYFESSVRGNGHAIEIPHGPIRDAVSARTRSPRAAGPAAATGELGQQVTVQAMVVDEPGNGAFVAGWATYDPSGNIRKNR